MSARFITRAAVYGALYAALTLIPGLNALAYGPFQSASPRVCSPSPVWTPRPSSASPSGTFVANWRARRGWLDVVVGTLLTVVVVLGMYGVGLRWRALAIPVVVNGLGVALVITLAQQLTSLEFLATAGSVAFGEAVVMATAGVAVFLVIKERGRELGLPDPEMGRHGVALLPWNRPRGQHTIDHLPLRRRGGPL